jgi:DNA-binding MarR family transcriptional regulator
MTKDTVEVKIEDLATLVAGMSRLLSRLASMPAFQEAGLGLAEWSALSIIAGKSGINNGQLAHALGVSAQRVNQITDSLRGAENISISASADDGRKKAISITAAGTQRLTELNSKLQPMVASALSKRPRVLGRASAMISKTLMRIATPAKGEGKKGKRRKRGETGETSAPAQDES